MIHEADLPLLGVAEQHAANFGLTTEASPQPSRILQDGDILNLDDLEFQVIHTPGHSPGGICLLFADRLIVGDTLFSGSIGRTDLPGGDHQQLIRTSRTSCLSCRMKSGFTRVMGRNRRSARRSGIIRFLPREAFMLQGKTIVLGVSGGIAVYKAVEVLRLLTKAGADVHVVMTKNAQEFVTPLTFQTLSGNPVNTELFNLYQEQEIGHISLADRADLFVLAPATANLIGKIAQGLADDLLTTSVMATKAPVLIVPAMNTNMYENPIYQNNEKYLTQQGYHVLEPASGYLACGWEGKGKLPDPEDIYAAALSVLTPDDLYGCRILITAGPTVKKLTRCVIFQLFVRQDGYAIAEAAQQRGARVVLVSGPTNLRVPVGVQCVPVCSAAEMRAAVLDHYAEADIVIKAAAVADYCVAERAHQKMKNRMTT